MSRVAAKHRAPCFVHVRYAGSKEPNNRIRAVEEGVSATAITGAPPHVVHVTSIGLRATPLLLQMIGEARSRGLDVTTELLPVHLRIALASPLTMIASEGLLQNGKGHRRGSGSYARVLGHNARDLRVLTLMDALRKMTLMPAHRLERFTPNDEEQGSHSSRRRCGSHNIQPWARHRPINL